MSFLEDLKKSNDLTRTEKGAVTYSTSGEALVDLFANGGAMRNRSENDKIDMFKKAFLEDNLLALKTLFYLRDVRGGQGERLFFRNVIKHLAEKHPEIVIKNIEHIPTFGRWDDLLVLIDTPCENDMFEFILKQLKSDATDEKPSLLAKWLPSVNTSSAKTRALSAKVRRGLKMQKGSYKKLLSNLRTRINIVEKMMSENNWSDINYEHLPSKASMLYRESFYRRDGERYTEFVEQLSKGEVKINSSTLYPHEIIEKVQYTSKFDNSQKLYEGMWNNLPNYGVEGSNTLVVADVSGSMSGTPMNVSIALALYMSERCTGDFHNHFITFESNPKLLSVKGADLYEKVRNIYSAPWGGSTNIAGVFELILKTAKKNKTKQEDLPKNIVIVSDMEFDVATYYHKTDSTLFEGIKERFEKHGYEMPKLVFWNVDARNSNFPMRYDENGTLLVSGYSPSILQSVLSDKIITPISLLLEVVNKERYSVITV